MFNWSPCSYYTVLGTQIKLQTTRQKNKQIFKKKKENIEDKHIIFIENIVIFIHIFKVFLEF